MAVSLHETCLEYFGRRLSEGWKCISLEGYNAVLLSPDGLRRELDLRNGVETLRPNADTAQKTIAGPAGAHYTQVDESSPDGDSTKVYERTVEGRQNIWHYDLYNLPASSGSGIINKITVYIVCRRYWTVGTYTARVKIKTEGSVRSSGYKALGASYVSYSQQWSTNPVVGGAWTWTQIDALQIGVGLLHNVYTDPVWDAGRCTQVYVEVDWSAVAAPTVTTQDATGIGFD